MARELLALRCEQDRQKKKALKTKKAVTWEQYKLRRNQVVHVIKQPHRFFHKVQVTLNSGNKTVMWNGIRHSLRYPDRHRAISQQRHLIIILANIGTKLARRLDNMPHSSSLLPTTYPFKPNSINVDFIYDQLLLLKGKSYNDIIKIDSKMMMIPSSYIIIDDAFWKCATVTSIYRGKGKSNDCGKYRLVSVTSRVSKIMEKVVLNRPLTPQFYNTYTINFY